ncbi:MAG TPA: hypothetical protein IAA45_03500 [Candidatus Blautia gallistercoris]|uniref:Uncharacterized protein n=1 Tax=Candidatus Blautia gallistercoris TaxID=2838490 RepID=A0A9D2B380_9FIRM|nr:hypothetical protein [Candidatus Blautia gallistercoris]
MSWKTNCYNALNSAKLFQDSGHRSRFKELIDCYGNYPFFSRGLCKCMYLSAWDEEHFCILLGMLTTMSLDQETSTAEMRIQGDVLASRQNDEEYYIYQLSISFLDNQPFHLDNNANIGPETMYIIQCALQAAEIIDTVSDQTESVPVSSANL